MICAHCVEREAVNLREILPGRWRLLCGPCGGHLAESGRLPALPDAPRPGPLQGRSGRKPALDEVEDA